MQAFPKEYKISYLLYREWEHKKQGQAIKQALEGGAHAAPDAPDSPDAPDASDAPDAPAVPAVPAAPDAPDVPATSAAPDVPDVLALMGEMEQNNEDDVFELQPPAKRPKLNEKD